MGRFSDEEILAIRSDPRPSTEVALEYDCHDSTIRAIRGAFTYEEGPFPDLEDSPEWKRGKSGPRPECSVKGEANRSAILTEEAVRWVREEKERYPERTNGVLAREVAREFGLPKVPSERTVSAIVNRETWSHLR